MASAAALRKLRRVAEHLRGTPTQQGAQPAPASAKERHPPEDVQITGVSVRDIRFHTSKDSSGSDARSPDPDYSCAYIELTTSVGLVGSGLAFTIGRGNETVVTACEVLTRFVEGLTLADIIGDFPTVWRSLTNDGQLCWIGPEKGPVHQAAAGIINAMSAPGTLGASLSPAKLGLSSAFAPAISVKCSAVL